jgi:hypothetical protein
MNLLAKLRSWFGRRSAPVHLQRGILGEHAARMHLEQKGLKFLASNFRSDHGEIDLIFRDIDCLLYVSFAMNIWLRHPAPACNNRWQSATCGSAPQAKPTAIRSGAKRTRPRRIAGRWGLPSAITFG